MPTEPILDVAQFAGKTPIYTRSEIEKHVPHRFEFALLDGVLHTDKEKKIAVGYYDAKPDAFWARGHIPGRPLMPGVLQVECCAQLCTFLFQKELNEKTTGFMGFGGMDEARFRGAVEPPARFIAVVRCDQLRPRASHWITQGFVDGKMVFEGKIFAVAF